MTPAHTKFFPLKNATSTRDLPYQGCHPTCSIPKCPTTMPTTGVLAPNIPPRGQYAGTSSSFVPHVGEIRSHRLPRAPFRIMELCGGLATGFEALLRAGYAINSYVWVDIDPDAHTVVSHRISHI
jgi:hypothetical protein